MSTPFCTYAAPSPGELTIGWEEERFLPAALALSLRLGLPLTPSPDHPWQLVVTDSGYRVQERQGRERSQVRLDLTRARPATSIRRELLGRAVAWSDSAPPRVLDCTGGFGVDSLQLLNWGCRVHILERHPVIFALLEEAMARAASRPDLAKTMDRASLRQGEALTLLQGPLPFEPEVILLDPMFPPRDKTALVSKEARLLQRLAGDGPPAEEEIQLLTLCRRLALKRVVVKRSRHGPCLGGIRPDFHIAGRSIRFDVHCTTA
ncbi:MAG: class I SAM-dependent methyltransferase [Magnetococcales bacterium]|nr:class I SAM-dependent methyltransferase [Magnetococcales bacterium]